MAKKNYMDNGVENQVFIFTENGWESTDKVTSGVGATLGGGAGDDRIWNGANNVRIATGAGNDNINNDVGARNLLIDAGDGNNHIRNGNGLPDGVTYWGGDGATIILIVNESCAGASKFCVRLRI